MIPLPGLSKIWSGVVAAAAVSGLLLGVLFMGRSWGKNSEAAQNLKAKITGQKVALKVAQEAVQLQSEASSDVAEVAEKRQSEKVASRSEDGVRVLGKWVVLAALLPFFLLAVVGCCGGPKVEVIAPPIMELEQLPRPELHNISIFPGKVLSSDEVERIFDNEFDLVTLVKQYEVLIEKFKEFVRRYKAEGGFSE